MTEINSSFSSVICFNLVIRQQFNHYFLGSAFTGAAWTTQAEDFALLMTKEMPLIVFLRLCRYLYSTFLTWNKSHAPLKVRCTTLFLQLFPA